MLIISPACARTDETKTSAIATAALGRGWETLQYMRKPVPEKFVEAYRRLDAKVKSLEGEAVPLQK